METIHYSSIDYTFSYSINYTIWRLICEQSCREKLVNHKWFSSAIQKWTAQKSYVTATSCEMLCNQLQKVMHLKKKLIFILLITKKYHAFQNISFKEHVILELFQNNCIVMQPVQNNLHFKEIRSKNIWLFWGNTWVLMQPIRIN